MLVRREVRVETRSRVPRVTYVKWSRGRSFPRSRCGLRSQSRAVSVVLSYVGVLCLPIRSDWQAAGSTEPVLTFSGYLMHLSCFGRKSWIIVPVKQSAK